MQISVIFKLANYHIFMNSERFINYVEIDTNKFHIACLFAEISINRNIYVFFALGAIIHILQDLI